MLFEYTPEPIFVGTDTESGKDIFVSSEQLETHVHINGPPGSGKTRLLLWMYMELIKRPDATVIVINPKGDLIRMARDAAINAGQGRRLILFDPADTEHIIGYNPLRPNGLGVTNHAKAAREAIRSAWGQNSFDGTAQLARFLFLALCAARELEMTLVEAVEILRAGSTTRTQVLERLQNPFVREALEYFDTLRESRQEELAASTLARLEAFVMDDTIRRIITQQAHNLDIGQVIENREILLVNLEEFKPLRPDDVKLLGRLIINDIVSHVFSRTGTRTPVFVFIDECHTFTTHDLCLILDKGRELGLHCVLAHQFPKQLLDEDPTGLLYGSVTECARSKIVFGGMSTEHLGDVAKELFLCEFDPLEVKDEIKTLVLEPVEAMRVVPTMGTSRESATTVSSSQTNGRAVLRGNTATEGEAHGVGSAVAQVTGTVVQNSDGETVLIGPDGEELQIALQGGSSTADTESTVYTTSEQHVKNRSRALQNAVTKTIANLKGLSRSDSSGRSLSFAFTPFYEYLKRYRVSSRTFWSFEEFIIRCMQRLQKQPQAHFVFKGPLGNPVFVRAPEVEVPFVPARLLAPILERICQRPIYATAVQIDHEEAQRRSALVRIPERRASSDRSDAVKSVRYRRNKGNSAA